MSSSYRTFIVFAPEGEAYVVQVTVGRHKDIGPAAIQLARACEVVRTKYQDRTCLAVIIDISAMILEVDSFSAAIVYTLGSIRAMAEAIGNANATFVAVHNGGLMQKGYVALGSAALLAFGVTSKEVTSWSDLADVISPAVPPDVLINSRGDLKPDGVNIIEVD